MRTITYLILILSIKSHCSIAQKKDSTSNKSKIINAGIASSIYLLSTYQSTQNFYQNYPYSTFKVKNDLNTWLGMDKAFHSYSSYQLCSIFMKEISYLILVIRKV